MRQEEIASRVSVKRGEVGLCFLVVLSKLWALLIVHFAGVGPPAVVPIVLLMNDKKSS